MDRVVVYTAMMGGYDILRAPKAAGKFVAFVDSASPVEGWTQKVIDRRGMGARRAARFYKTQPHIWLSDADITIWIDANVRLLVNPQRLVDEWLGDAQIAVPKHPSRQCAYNEARGCAVKGKITPDEMKRQRAAYQAAGFPRNFGLAETRCLIRRNVPDVTRFNDLWWKHIEQFTARDQVSFPFAVWKTSVGVNYVDAWVPGHPYFEYHEHGA